MLYSKHNHLFNTTVAKSKIQKERERNTIEDFQRGLFKKSRMQTTSNESMASVLATR